MDTEHYTTESLLTSIIATMLGCKPASGLVNTLNDLSREGKIEPGDTYGWILRQVCEHELARLNESGVTRKPLTEAA